MQHAARSARHLLGDRQRGAAQVPAPHAATPTEERVERFGRPTLIEQFDSLPIEDFQQEFEGKFVDETYSFFPYELILPCTNDELVLYDEPTSVRAPEGRIVAGFDVGRTRDRSELAVFEEIEGRFTCRMLKSFEGTPFAEQEAELRQHLRGLVGEGPHDATRAL